jgi:hypothetical protein
VPIQRVETENGPQTVAILVRQRQPNGKHNVTLRLANERAEATPAVTRSRWRKWQASLPGLCSLSPRIPMVEPAEA